MTITILFSVHLIFGLIFFFKGILPFEQKTGIEVYIIFFILSLIFGVIPFCLLIFDAASSFFYNYNHIKKKTNEDNK